MENKEFLFVYNDVRLKVTVPVENQSVITSQFCPRELITGGHPFILAINGESINEFVTHCQKQVVAISISKNNTKKIDRHIGGLMAIILEHISNCRRLIFGDLLIYVDCFAHLLKADGFTDVEIKDIYPEITKTIVDFYPDYVKATADLSPFRTTPIYMLLSDMVKN